MELCSTLYGSLEGRRVWERMNTCICMTDSLHCSPESITTLLMSYTPWTVAHQTSLSMGFSRQEYCSGLQSPSPQDLSDPEIEPGSPFYHVSSREELLNVGTLISVVMEGPRF